MAEKDQPNQSTFSKNPLIFYLVIHLAIIFVIAALIMVVYSLDFIPKTP